MSVISFNELVSGSAGVRVADDGESLSIRDIIMVVCSKNNNEAGEVWRRLQDSHKNELQEFISTFQFPGRGQSSQPVITLPGAIKLIMWLPGNMAKEFRSKACDILTRYLAGDGSLVAEVEANAGSNEPLNIMARQSLKRAGDELEIQQRKLAIREKEIELSKSEIEVRCMRMEADEREALIPAKLREFELTQQQSIVAFYQSLCPGGIVDDRAKLLFKDCILNLTGSPQLAITNNPDSNPKSVSDIATSMGKKFSPGDIIKVGVVAATKYRERYGPKESPGKHGQFVNGRMCEVNHYVARDHDLVNAAVSEFIEFPK